jgi:hypothetical protein
MKKGKELSARSYNRSQAQSERRRNEKKSIEAEIRRKVEDYMNGRGIGDLGTSAAKGGSVGSVHDEPDAASSENLMIETADSSDLNNIEQLNENSSSRYNDDGHHNELGDDIRRFFIPLAVNDREEVRLFEVNYQKSSLTGSLADQKAKNSNQCLKESLVQKKKKKVISNAAAESPINDDNNDDDDGDSEEEDEARWLLNYENTIFTVNFDDDDDDRSDEDYLPDNYDAFIENHNYELDDEERAAEMGEGDSSVDDEGTAVMMQENAMEWETNLYEGFDIVVLSEDITCRILQQRPPIDDDSDLVAMEDSKSSSTKGEFCRDIQAFLTVHNIGASKDAKDALIKMLYKHIPELNLPIYLNRRKNQCQNMDSYVESDLRNLSFDCCKAGCTVFVGSIFSQLECCEHCKSSRYLPCAREPCKTHPNRICTHPKKNRVAVQKLYYRPIIPLIAMLLKTEGFVTALQYKYVQYNGQQFGDLSYGSNIKNHLKQMKEDVFDGFFDRNRQYRKQDFVFVPLLFGKNFDGVQVYSSQFSNFHPLFLTILNLPPSYRNKSGKRIQIYSIILCMYR